MPDKRKPGIRVGPPQKNIIQFKIDDELNKWLEAEVKKGRYESKAHACRQGLKVLRHQASALPEGMSV